MADRIIRFNKSLLHFKVVGTGSRNLFIFHGFGQDHQAFKTVSDALSSAYTLYVFDLYFHGKSEWGHDELPLEKDHWKSTMEILLKEYHIERFSLAGYSLGGKFVLATAEAFPDKTKAIFLLAPDGIKTSFWYSLATYPILFRKLFKSMISHPDRFAIIVNTLRRAGLLDKGLLRFVELQMNTPEKRKQVYYSWVVFRRLEFDLKSIANMINHHSIPLTIVIGKYDKVIKPENMRRLLRHLKNYRLEIVETGHNSLIRESIPFLK